jgi:D-glycero-D-manno-heptose 1,7-bisphosphate phosphatase
VPSGSGPPPSEPARRPAVFLDRDGTLVEERDYLRRVEELELLPGAAQALSRLQAAGYALVLCTNQSAVARGLLDERALAAIHAELERRLAIAGVRLDAIEVCPHHPEVGEFPYRRVCDCRKPAPGLLQRALRELPLRAETSVVVGDSERDLQAGAALGIPGILVRTGKGASEEARMLAAGRPPALVVDDLPAAAREILAGRVPRAPHFS